MPKMRRVVAATVTLVLALAVAAPTAAQEAVPIDGTVVGEHWIGGTRHSSRGCRVSAPASPTVMSGL